jgi:phosphate transport system substrate-binding protein
MLLASGPPALCAGQTLAGAQDTSAAAGVIRVTGSPADRSLIEALQAGFSGHQPNQRFSNTLHGPESTLAGVYTGVADLAFMARELREPMERMAFEWARLSKPFVVEIANAGLYTRRPASQFGIFVHPDSPLNSISLDALDAIFGAEHLRAPRLLRSWGDLGLDGGWRLRPITPMGPEIDSILGLFFRRNVMRDSRKWNPGYHGYEDDQQALGALRNEPGGIVFASLPDETAGVKALAVSVDGESPAYCLGRDTVIARTWPLTRVVSIALYRAAGERIEPRLEAFIRFVLSAEGQQIIAADGAYLPLSGASVSQQLERLE